MLINTHNLLDPQLMVKAHH